MRFARQKPAPRHFAGSERASSDTAGSVPELDHDAPRVPAFTAAGDEPIDIFEGTLPEPGEVTPKVRVAPHRIAFAVSVTLAALPFLVLDNLPATADTGHKPVEVHHAADGTSQGLGVDVDASDPLHGTIDLDAPTTYVTVAPPAVFVETPVTTISVVPPTTAAPSTTTPTTAPKQVAPRVIERLAPTTTAAPTTTVAPPTTVAQAAAPARLHPSPDDPATWDQLAKCESGGNWAANTGNGYYGGLQFSLPTWQHLGGTGYPHEASKATQIEMGKRLQASSGWAAWPGCAKKLNWE